MRRNVGIAGLQRSMQQREQFRSMGDRLASAELQQLTEQMAIFKCSLEAFATKHRKEIAQNAAFRLKFQEMCAAIGVDPLASSKGFWGELLGVGDWYYDLSVRVVEACIALRDRRGPLVLLSDLVRVLNAGKNGENVVTEDDVCRSIKLLEPLASGFALQTMPNVPGRRLVHTIPKELNMDLHSVHTLLNQQQKQFCSLSVDQLANQANWASDRARIALDLLAADGELWIDNFTGYNEYYQYPGDI